MKRKLVAFLMALSLVVPQVCFASGKGEQLEKTIQIVKSKVEIPKTLDQFSYEQYDDLYEMFWRDANGSAEVEVRCTPEGQLMGYYYYKEQEDKPNKVSSIDSDKARQVAEAFLNKMVPEYAKELQFTNLENNLKRDNLIFEYTLVHEGIPVYGQNVMIQVNKQTGEVESFRGIQYNPKMQYSTNVVGIDVNAAQKIYLSEIGLPMSYYVYTNRRDKAKVFLAYTLENPELAIQAQTGKKIEMYEEEKINVPLGDMGAVTEDFKEASVENLMPAEVEAVESTKGYMTAEEICKKASAYFPVLATMSILNTNTYKDQYDERINIRLDSKENRSARLECDPKTGEVYCYRYYDERREEKNEKKPISEIWKGASEFVKQVNPEKSSSITLKDATIRERTPNEQCFNFVRTVNGIAVQNDSIDLVYDADLKQVVNYEVSWEKDVDFPNAKGVLTPEEVIQKIGLKLYYLQTGEYQYTLVYKTDGANDIFDAHTGKAVNRRGEEKNNDKSQGIYTDIKGHQAESIITQLYNSGIYLEGSVLKPDEAITQKEFLRVLHQAREIYKDDEGVYKIAIKEGILNEDEKQLDKQLLRAEGVKYIINTTNYKELALQSKLFKYPYQDQKVSEATKGYITVAYGLNVLDHNSKNFRPEEKLTKAEAMVMIYNALQNEVI